MASELAHVLALPRRQLDGFLGAVGGGLASRGQVLAALRQCRSLQVGLCGGELFWLRGSTAFGVYATGLMN